MRGVSIYPTYEDFAVDHARGLDQQSEPVRSWILGLLEGFLGGYVVAVVCIKAVDLLLAVAI